MEASEFIRLAEPDRSTTLDRIGDIIDHWYTPGSEADCSDTDSTQDDEPMSA